jgi:hypothetical protein
MVLPSVPCAGSGSLLWDVVAATTGHRLATNVINPQFS